MRVAVIELENGISGLVFLKTNIPDMIRFISKHRKNPKKVLKFDPKNNIYVFGASNTIVSEGNTIIYSPLDDTFHLSKNPKWIDDYYFKY